MDDLDDIKQGTINNLKGQLCMEEITTINSNKFKFLNDDSFVLNGDKNGKYQIFFADNLTLFLNSNDGFVFKDNTGKIAKGVSLTSYQNNFETIFDQVKHLRIEFIV